MATTPVRPVSNAVTSPSPTQPRRLPSDETENVAPSSPRATKSAVEPSRSVAVRPPSARSTTVHAPAAPFAINQPPSTLTRWCGVRSTRLPGATDTSVPVAVATATSDVVAISHCEAPGPKARAPATPVGAASNSTPPTPLADRREIAPVACNTRNPPPLVPIETPSEVPSATSVATGPAPASDTSRTVPPPEPLARISMATTSCPACIVDACAIASVTPSPETLPLPSASAVPLAEKTSARQPPSRPIA